MRKLLLVLVFLPSLAPAATGQKAGVNSAPNLTGNSSASTVVATGSTAARSLAARAADVINVLDFGAWTDGSEANAIANTTRIQAALTAGAGKDVVFPPGTYVIDGISDLAHRDSDGGGLLIPGNTRVVLMPGAAVKQTSTASEYYKVFRVGNSAYNVTITGGGTIQGDRDTHTYGGGTHEWGYCVAIVGAVSRVTIENVTVKDCTGDGLYVGDFDSGASRPSNVTIRNVLSTNNRRQGMSITGVAGMKVEGSTFENTNGIAPQAGVDIEPGGFGHGVSNVTFANSHFRGNAGRGIVALGTTGADVASLSVVGGSSTGNTFEGVSLTTVTGGASVSGMIVSGNGDDGISVLSSSDILISGNFVSGNSQTTDAASEGISLQTSTRPSVIGNTVRHGGGAKQQRYAIQLNTLTDAYVSGNDLKAGGRTEDIHSAALTTSVVSGNVGSIATFTPLAGLLGEVSATASTPTASFYGSTSPSGRTYGFSLQTAAEAANSGGAFTIGTGNKDTEAYAEVRGGLPKSGDAGSNVSGVRFMRGKASTGFETLLQADQRILLNRGLVTPRVVPTYGVLVAIDCWLGNHFDIYANNGTAFTVANPTNTSVGQHITVRLRNSSAGALGAVTWDTAFKLAAWTSPASGFSRSVSFVYDGTNWIEVSRTPADVPN